MNGAVLISGASTPLGQQLIEVLLAQDPERSIIAVALDPPDQVPELWHHPSVEYRCVDLRRQRRMRQLLFGAARDLGVRTVVHLASHRSAAAEGRRAHRLNVDVTRDLLHLCEGHPTIERFIYRSFVDVYDIRAHQPDLIGEEHPLNLSPSAPQWVRDKVHADLMVCTQLGLGQLEVLVLRAAECFAADMGSQVYDYLGSRVCYRPAGFDPMTNLISLPDLTRALHLALESGPPGIYNIPGRDTLPLSAVIRLSGRTQIPAPGLLLRPLYAARRLALGTDFTYRVSAGRFHYSGILDGGRARDILGFEPEVPVDFRSCPDSWRA